VYTPSTREAELLVFEHLVLAEEDGLAVYRNQTSRVDLWPWPCLESLMHVKKVKSYDGIVAHYSGQKPSKNPVTGSCERFDIARNGSRLG
jgi:hypothetical protein